MKCSRLFPLMLVLFTAGTTLINAGYWQWANPLPAGGQLDDITVFSDNRTLISCGNFNNFVLSTDCGNNWSSISSPAGENPYWFHSIHFINDRIGFVGGEPFKVYKTIDNGISWFVSGPMIYDSTKALWDIEFVNENKGYAVGGAKSYSYNSTVSGKICVTNDGGFSWTELSTPSTVRAVEVIDQNTAFAVGFGGLLVKTTNGGLSWESVTSPADNSKHLLDIHFFDHYIGIVVGVYFVPPSETKDYMLRTTDGGNTWFEINYHDDNLGLTSIISADNNTQTAIAVGGILGNPPKILRSTDMGITWTKISSPANSSLLRAIYKSGIFFIVGHCGNILKSIDNGITWIRIDNSITVNNLFAIDFPQNGNIGYAVGKLGTVLKSTNSGSTWTLQTTPVNSVLFGLSFFDSTYGIAVGGKPTNSSGDIIYTTNAGQNWYSANVNLYTVMYDVEYVSFNNAVAVGSNGTIMKSTDNGYNWKKVNLDYPISNHLRRICFVDNRNGFICGTGGIFLKTEDGGDNWSQIQTGLSVLHVMDFCTPSIGVVGNVDEDIYKTTNGGRTWQLILEKEEIYNLKQVAMPNQNVIIVEYIYGNLGYVPPSLTHKFYCSYDGGSSWVDYDCPVNWPLDFFYNPVNNTMITCGYFGEIRYKNDFLNTDYLSTSDSYESLTSQIPTTEDDVKLIYNSLSEKYVINVINSSIKHYSYNIFDLSGRIVTNANGTITSDNQSIQLNTENLTSGSFFLVFNVGNHSINRKLTIVR